MRAGKLDRRITLERKTTSDGQWGLEETWSELATVWASYEAKASGEEHASGEVLARRITVFRIRYFEGLSEEDRFTYNGNTYNILGISEIGRREGLELRAEVIRP